MKTSHLALLLTLLTASVSSIAASPYAGQESREIKALSPEDVTSLLAGKGMGFAKAAELNGYAGPAHVLELATELGLSSDQLRDTKALFESMSLRAKTAGKKLIGRERELDRMFASKDIDSTSLSPLLHEIASLEAEVRDAHLAAHLAQVKILSDEQNARYVALRGYGTSTSHQGHVH